MSLYYTVLEPTLSAILASREQRSAMHYYVDIIG